MIKKRKSKELTHSDDCAFRFIQRVLNGRQNSGYNFERLSNHPVLGEIFFELLRCNEEQGENGITPFTSHPNKYWHKNSKKFISQFRHIKKFKGTKTYFLINYADKGEKYEDEVKVIQVLAMDVNKGITKENSTCMNYKEFCEWFNKINDECLEHNF